MRCTIVLCTCILYMEFILSIYYVFMRFYKVMHAETRSGRLWDMKVWALIWVRASCDIDNMHSEVNSEHFCWRRDIWLETWEIWVFVSQLLTLPCFMSKLLQPFQILFRSFGHIKIYSILETPTETRDVKFDLYLFKTQVQICSRASCSCTLAVLEMQ